MSTGGKLSSRSRTLLASVLVVLALAGAAIVGYQKLLGPTTIVAYFRSATA
ncbi:mammalian cell entry protein, partial [Mycobacterium sp. ITM-2017-0098]